MSRKKQNIQKITALYCRLSLEDGRENESMSISNQKLMLKDFAEKNGMFRYEYYVDDGYTGRNFNGQIELIQLSFPATPQNGSVTDAQFDR